jgi:hypothetical protein
MSGRNVTHRATRWLGLGGAAIALTACTAGRPALAPTAIVPSLSGHVSFEPPRHTQATMTEVANAATVSLVDAVGGTTVSSSVTDSAGNFVLTFSNLTPPPGAVYVLEAVKGLSAGSGPNRAGAAAVRIRTLLFWNNGWQSLTNSIVNQNIVVNPGTTALSAIASLRQLGAASMSALINTVSATDSSFVPGGTGLSNANDYQPVLTLVNSAIQLDQDPIGQIARNSNNGTYSLPTGVPVITSFSPAIPTPGGNLIVRGAYLDKIAGRNTFWFGSIAASTWSVGADRTQATVSIPANAYSAPLVLQQPNGVAQTVSPYLFLHGTVGTFVGDSYTNWNDGVGNLAEFNFPIGINLFGGFLYLADANNSRIRKINLAGAATTLAGNSTAATLDGLGSAAEFNGPYGMALDPFGSGMLYAAENGGACIRRISPNGQVTTIAGNGAATDADGPLLSASFNGPRWVAFDATGSMYVTDASGGSGFGSLRKIASPSFSTVTTLVPNSLGVLNYPHGLAIDAAGTLYVGDTRNHVIRRVTPAGAVSTYAGTVGTSGAADGATTSATFNEPRGIALDQTTGNLYVADTMNHRIRLITPAGGVSTVAGTGPGYQNGPLLSAQFNQPRAIALDGQGNMYVTDSINNMIRTVTP